MDEKQMEELNKAISKLSEEDQAQIAAGSKITDEQCKSLKSILGGTPKIDVPSRYSHMHLDYGGPIPRKLPLIETEELNKLMDERKKSLENKKDNNAE